MDSKASISSFTVIVSFLCLTLVGIALVPSLPVKLSPSRTLPRLAIDYTMPGNSSRIIEMEVTSKLEATLSRIKGIKRISSTSGNGWGRITIELDKHTDMEAARFEASTVIRQTWSDLPDGLSYPTIETSCPDESSSRPFMSYTLNAPASPALIQRLAEERIKPQLSGLPGIRRIDVSGATPMEWRLEYDSDRMRELEITIEDIQAAINRHLNREFLGTVSREREGSGKEWIRLSLAPEGNGKDLDPAQITVTSRDGALIRLDQIAKVSRREEAPRGYFRINGLNSIYLSIQADESANQLRLARSIREEMGAVSASLPTGYEIHTSYDATEYIWEELYKIYVRTGLTVLILLLFVLLITRNIRYLALITVSLAINLCVAVIPYYLLGLEIQLYSLAGITISLSLVIDNTIVMADHIRRQHDRKAFLSILAATLTTMGALVIIFFLDEEIRLNLQDFAAVVIINLGVSLLIALLLVPALIDKMGLSQVRTGKGKSFAKRLAIYFTRYYHRQVKFLYRWRRLAYTILTLGFGLPVFLLPDRIDPEGDNLTAIDSTWIGRYNRLAENPLWKETLRPAIEKALGGTLRLFAEDVYEGSYLTREDETILSIGASMPNGTTLEQMNHLVGRMEAYLMTFKGIRQFQTSIHDARQATIDVYFTRDSERGGFPYTLKSRVVRKALELGGGSWSVWGLPDESFSNDIQERAGSFRIELLGYNYDELYGWAGRLRDRLLTYRRIKEVTISSEFSWWKDDYQEFYLDPDRGRMAQTGLSPADLYSSLRTVFGRDIHVGTVMAESGAEAIRLSSRQSGEFDIWSLRNMPIANGDGTHKLSDIASVEKGQAPSEIAKVDQQYRLCLQYEYIGSTAQGERIQERELREFNQILPMGYTAKAERGRWSWGDDNGQYALLGLVIVIIFFITGILFDSLRQPLAILCVIPVSYIGVFLTFYLFKLNFDQGGFASFVLLCGITVNASIYILNEYNRIRSRRSSMPPLPCYLKAWNTKIIPIFLTVVSTILGFLPFLLGSDKEAFWFPLAAGTIGGLAMSIVGIFIYLPLFALRKKEMG